MVTFYVIVEGWLKGQRNEGRRLSEMLDLWLSERGQI